MAHGIAGTRAGAGPPRHEQGEHREKEPGERDPAGAAGLAPQENQTGQIRYIGITRTDPI